MTEKDNIACGNKPKGNRVDWLRKELNRPLFICGILASVTILLFWPLKNFAFINFDDPEYVTSNPRVLRGMTMEGLAWALSTFYAGNWHPLTWLSHMLDTQVFGYGPSGPHFINVLLHAANSTLLFLALRKLTSSHWRSAAVAFIFAVHPLRVESVAWISERKDLLCGTFTMLTVLAYCEYARKHLDRRPDCAHVLGRRGPGEGTAEESEVLDGRNYKTKQWYGLTIFLFGLALMSKPMAVTLPFVLLLIDYWPLGTARNPRELVRCARDKLPLFVLSAACSVITFIAQRQGGAVHSLATMPIAARIENSLVAYAGYLGEIFWPSSLANPYPHPIYWPLTRVLLSSVIILGISLGVMRQRVRMPYLLTGWFWFLGMLVPVIGLVQVGVQSSADRYTYLPSIGLLIAIVWCLETILRNKAFCGIGLAGALLSYSIVTHNQLQYWQDSEKLFSHAIAVTRNNYLAQDNLGFALYEKGKINEAIAHYREALKIYPTSANTFNNLGTALSRLNQPEASIRCYENAVRIQPNFVDARINLGAALFRAGNTQSAIQQYQAALRLDPDSAEAHNNFANALVSLGRLKEGIAHYRIALHNQPTLTQAWNNLGWVLTMSGEYLEAVACFRRALDQRPDDGQVEGNLADCFARMGRDQEAMEHYQKALKLNPSDAEAYFGIGQVERRLGRMEEARMHFKKAVELKPDYAEAKNALGALPGER